MVDSDGRLLEMHDCCANGLSLLVVIAPDVRQVGPKQYYFAGFDRTDPIADDTCAQTTLYMAKLQFRMEVPRASGETMVNPEDSKRLINVWRRFKNTRSPGVGLIIHA